MKILAPTAGVVPAKENASYIINIAKKLGAEIIALHVLGEDEDTRKGREALAVFHEAGLKAGINVTKVLREGDVVSDIIECAKDQSADLIIMGASEGKVISEWVGSNVKSRTTAQVLVIPSAFFKVMTRAESAGICPAGASEQT